MNPLIVYHTETGNTLEIAEAMAAAIQADLKAADSLTAADLENRTLIGLGSGIYTLQHVYLIRRLVSRLPAGCRVFFSLPAGWPVACLPRPGASPIGGCAGLYAGENSPFSGSGTAPVR